MTDRKTLIYFTKYISELVNENVSLKQAVFDLACEKKLDGKLRSFCLEINCFLEEGRKLSWALEYSSVLKVPQWYWSFMTVAEETGKVREIFCFLLENLESMEKSRNQFLTGLIYPFFVIVMAFFCSALIFFVFPAFSQDRRIFFAACGKGFCFIGVIFIFLLAAFQQVLKNPGILIFFKAMAFLTESSVSLGVALECGLTIAENDRKLEKALFAVRRRVAGGEKLNKAFAEELESGGFKNEGKLLGECLFASQRCGNKNCFSRTVEVLEEKNEGRKKMILNCLEPFSICGVAIYVVILLKDTVLPFITGQGGLF